MFAVSFRKLALGALALPLALGLAACGDDAADTATTTGDPIENVAPPEGKSWTEVVAKTEAGGYVVGNPDAPIKLVEFGSLTCNHCANFAAMSGEELYQDFVASGRVSFEFRNFIMNPLDLTMAMMTRCGSPESYFALVEQTFANQQDLIQRWEQAGEQPVTQALSLPAEQRYIATAELVGLTDFYSARGISADQARSCLADGGEAEALVQNTAKQSEAYDITGTPSFLINGRKVEGNNWPEVKTQLENMGAR